MVATVRVVLECFPAIYFACHRRHVVDERSRSVLSTHQASVLDHLDESEPTHLHELARHMGITPSSMSLMIDRLERGGFVRRGRDAQDRRRINLLLTKAGQRIKQRQKVLDPDLVESLLMKLTASERQAALKGLELLARAAREMSAGGEMQWKAGRA